MESSMEKSTLIMRTSIVGTRVHDKSFYYHLAQRLRATVFMRCGKKAIALVIVFCAKLTPDEMDHSLNYITVMREQNEKKPNMFGMGGQYQKIVER
ncbi:hypothetical protein Tcan_09932 [Toxocara canis]|uniref:Uncharacterized protein n=1 Tax=Toxocara canis TaxID=6265 RepID=A0A0B2UZA2_TOXCA|nr:hypothetical protein Tcan_09932 [Toxocara canis]